MKTFWKYFYLPYRSTLCLVLLENRHFLPNYQIQCQMNSNSYHSRVHKLL